VKVALDEFRDRVRITYASADGAGGYHQDRQVFRGAAGAERGSAAIIEGVSMIANKLGMRLLAEGIEKEMQAAQLCNFGCVLGQGFLYSPAVDRFAMTDLMLGHAQGSGRLLRADDHQPPSAASVARRR
jgi:EAL domain-containing protein (putative c-di-GMP-specific phosphodiesterase class I)